MKKILLILMLFITSNIFSQVSKYPNYTKDSLNAYVYIIDTTVSKPSYKMRIDSLIDTYNLAGIYSGSGTVPSNTIVNITDFLTFNGEIQTTELTSLTQTLTVNSNYVKHNMIYPNTTFYGYPFQIELWDSALVMAAGLFSDAITPYALPAINFVSSQTNNKYNLLPAYGNKGYLTVTSPNTIVASDSSTFIGSNATDGVIHIDSNNDIIIQADSNLNINANNAYIDAVNEMLIDGKAVYVNADSSINMQANEEIILSSSIDLTIQGLTNTYVLPGTQGIKFDNTHKGIMSFIADTISTSIAAILPQQSGDVVINASPFDGCGDFDIVSVTPNTLGNSSIPSYVQVTAGNLGSGLIQLRLFNGSTATTLGADNYGFTISCIGIKY